MKLYSIKPEYCYGDDNDQQRKAQLDMLAQVGVKEYEAIGVALCNAEQALSLIIAGYCGKYLSNSAILEIDISSTIQSPAKCYTNKKRQKPTAQSKNPREENDHDGQD